MPSLNKTTAYTRFILMWAGIIIGSILLLIMLFKMGRSIKEYFYPTPPPPPTVSFGKIPAIAFPDSPIKDKFTYKLETVTGNFPYFPDRATVFQITPVTPTLLDTDVAREKVANIGFADQFGKPYPEKKISATTYQWDDQTSLHRILTMNINSFNFTLTSSYINDEDVKKGTNLPPEAKAINTAQQFIESLGLFATDIDPDRTKTTLLSIKDGTVQPATSFSTAQLIRVNFYQKDAEELPMVYPYPPYSLINIVVSGGGVSETGQIVEAKYVHRDVTQNSATYPIKTAAAGYNELQQGKGYIASLNGSGKDIVIRNISVGYFIGDGEQDYLLPVIIFEGDNNFIAYVSAVTDDWLTK